MENLGMFIVAALIMAVIAYAAIWAFTTEYFVEAGTTNEVDTSKALIVAGIFGVVVVLVLWYAHREGYLSY